MDQAHLHLLFNHMPILGSLFGMILLLVGLVKSSRTVQRTGLWTLFLTAILTLPAFFTGEGAEHATEHLIGSSHAMMHEHEELAEKALIFSLVLGLVSIVLATLIARNKHIDYKKFVWMTFGLSVVTFFIMVLVGNHGGKARRPELRGENMEQYQKVGEHGEHHYDDDDDDHHED
ncbi:MAG: hypothetical protein N4A41_05075 [Crocinitomicaceae bacterium]|jgi:uncharacterized membrane protein|nr:hypothetical protein [Crocinitomicaceae bacterium]